MRKHQSRNARQNARKEFSIFALVNLVLDPTLGELFLVTYFHKIYQVEQEITKW